jgi:hypothetical protein
VPAVRTGKFSTAHLLSLVTYSIANLAKKIKYFSNLLRIHTKCIWLKTMSGKLFKELTEEQLVTFSPHITSRSSHAAHHIYFIIEE